MSLHLGVAIQSKKVMAQEEVNGCEQTYTPVSHLLLQSLKSEVEKASIFHQIRIYLRVSSSRDVFQSENSARDNVWKFFGDEISWGRLIIIQKASSKSTGMPSFPTEKQTHFHMQRTW